MTEQAEGSGVERFQLSDAEEAAMVAFRGHRSLNKLYDDGYQAGYAAGVQGQASAVAQAVAAEAAEGVRVVEATVLQCVAKIEQARAEGYAEGVEHGRGYVSPQDTEAMETIHRAATLVKRDKLDDAATVAEQALVEERAAIVAWLRAKARGVRADGRLSTPWSDALDFAAEELEEEWAADRLTEGVES